VPLTVGQVAALPDLGLSVRTTSADLDRTVRWVAVSEHADPTPWLEGGDLLLTTGMSITGEDEPAAEYVTRLVAADVAALGFGVGLSHQSVPAALVAAAEAAGLPLLEVPQPIPFVALSKAVSRLLTAEEYAESATSFESQRRLIRAALAEPGAAGVIPVLAKQVGGFALHLDPSGAVVAAYPSSSAARAGALGAELDRLRSRGLLASAAVATAEEHVVILPIGVKGAAEGFLVVGSPRVLRSADQAVMNLAVSVLSWQASQPTATEAGMDAWRRLLLSSAAEHGLEQEILDGLGLPGLHPRRAVAVAVRGVNDAPVADADLSMVHRSGSVVLCRTDGGLTGFAAVEDDGTPSSVVRALADVPGVRVVGVSCVLDLTDPANVRQSRHQAAQAAAIGSGLRLYEDEPARGLTSLLDAATTSAWAQGYLGELRTSAEGPELMDTLRAWLDQHGQVDAAAQRLGIHRHTVRHRLRRAEGVLGRSLDDPAVRADLWFALAAVRLADASSNAAVGDHG
jgi:purine catabolism regulator